MLKTLHKKNQDLTLAIFQAGPAVDVFFFK